MPGSKLDARVLDRYEKDFEIPGIIRRGKGREYIRQYIHGILEMLTTHKPIVGWQMRTASPAKATRTLLLGFEGFASFTP